MVKWSAILKKQRIQLSLQWYRKSSINPLSPNIHVQILQTDLYAFP